MAWTQADIDALKTALATGASEVQRGDEKVRYRSVSEMRSQLAKMEAEVAGRSGGSSIKVHYPNASRGL